MRRIVELDTANRTNNDTVRNGEVEIRAVIRTIGLPAMRPNDFLALEKRADIHEAIAAQDAKAESIPAMAPGMDWNDVGSIE